MAATGVAMATEAAMVATAATVIAAATAMVACTSVLADTGAGRITATIRMDTVTGMVPVTDTTRIIRIPMLTDRLITAFPTQLLLMRILTQRRPTTISIPTLSRLRRRGRGR